MPTHKKGMSEVLSMVIGLLVILLAAGIVVYALVNASDSVNKKNCIGSCEEKCIGQVLKQSNTCYIDGEKKDGVCCATPQQVKDALAKQNEKDNQNGGTDDIPKGDVIEVRLNDDMSTKLGLEEPLVILEQGKTYKLSVWGFGPSGKTCQIKFLDNDGNVPTTGFLFGKGITQQDCVDPDIKTNAYSPNRKSKYVLTVNDITPKGGETGFYKLWVYMYDKDGTGVASYPIDLRVTTNNEDIPLFDDLPKDCPYKSCSEVPENKCLIKAEDVDGVPDCPDLNCRLELGGVGQPNKCVNA